VASPALVVSRESRRSLEAKILHHEPVAGEWMREAETVGALARGFVGPSEFFFGRKPLAMSG
jgi:hypothetical protein